MEAHTAVIEDDSPKTKTKKLKKPKSSSKKTRNPNKPRGTAYRMRYDKKGTIWHSIVDIDRPNSPEVEWPEYKNMKIKEDFPKEEFMSGYIDPGVDALLTKAGFVTPGYKPQSAGITPENPEEADDILDTVKMPVIPGLYPGDTRTGQFDDDDYDDDYADFPSGTGQNGWQDPDDDYDE